MKYKKKYYIENEKKKQFRKLSGFDRWVPKNSKKFLISNLFQDLTSEVFFENTLHESSLLVACDDIVRLCPVPC